MINWHCGESPSSVIEIRADISHAELLYEGLKLLQPNLEVRRMLRDLQQGINDAAGEAL